MEITAPATPEVVMPRHRATGLPATAKTAPIATAAPAQLPDLRPPIRRRRLSRSTVWRLLHRLQTPGRHRPPRRAMTARTAVLGAISLNRPRDATTGRIGISAGRAAIATIETSVVGPMTGLGRKPARPGRNAAGVALIPTHPSRRSRP